jgi:hypothetical protein
MKRPFFAQFVCQPGPPEGGRCNIPIMKGDLTRRRIRRRETADRKILKMRISGGRNGTMLTLPPGFFRFSGRTAQQVLSRSGARKDPAAVQAMRDPGGPAV